MLRVGTNKISVNDFLKIIENKDFSCSRFFASFAWTFLN
ncbi:MAG: hypothetical protein WKF59_06875 [Chitinophagaceae bacterium]